MLLYYVVMLKLKMSRKTIILYVVVACFVLIIGVILYFMIFKNEPTANQGNQQEVDQPLSLPDQKFVENLRNKVNLESTSISEKAKTYKTIADTLSLQGDYKGALEAYKQAKLLQSETDFTEEEIVIIDSSIEALQYRVDFNESTQAEITDGFKEPNE